MVNDFFNWCVYVLEVIGSFTGMGYELANIVIFVIYSTCSNILFFVSLDLEKKKNKVKK
jgi:hypothetical protein